MVESANHCSALEGIFSRTCVGNEMSDFTELVFQPENRYQSFSDTLISSDKN